MATDGDARLTITDAGKDAGVVTYEVEHVELDGGETQLVRLTFDVLGVSASLDFHVDQAETLLVQLRDKVVRAKEARLEWKTDTGSDTGVTEEGHGDD